ncbi:caspase, EACC1-associated type [Streptomyces sp. NPDC002073]
MTEPRRTGDLAGPGARAVVVGTAAHSTGSGLPGLPSVEATVRDLAHALHQICGMDPSRIELLLDPADGATVVEAVEQAVEEARGLVLFAFVGHGLLGPQDQLYLATATSSANGIARSIPYQVIRDTLSNSGARVVVLLDCCFSGMAQPASRGSFRDPYVTARPDGSFLLTSASLYEVSFAPEGDRHTLFTGKLLGLLHRGDPSAPAWLSLDGVYAHLDRQLQDGPVRPHRQSEDRAGELVVAANRAYPAPCAPSTELAHPADGTACPYPGMEPFRAEDHERFFGREELVDGLLAELTRPTGPPDGADRTPVVLVGASGVGKSSILRAGLLAGLERRYESDPDIPWPALLLASPGPHPVRALADLWARASGTAREEVERQLREGRLPDDGTCRVLVVDQFEEIFTNCRSAEERTRFIRALCHTANTGAGAGSGPRVVLGLRADHYGNCLEHPELRPALQRQWNVWPMDNDALRAAIEHPAHDAGLRLETALVDVLLKDTREGGGRDHGSALPFLAHALRETWVRRSGATLTLAGYAATGGIWESVARTAEDIYEGFDGPGREAVRELLLTMVMLAGSGEEAVRRRIGLDELLADRPQARRDTIVGVRDRLARARLITVGRTEAQISHEALLRAWPRLRRWIEEDRAGLVTRQQLTDAADAWHRAGRSSEYCYRGTRLVAAADWLGEQRHARLVRPLDHEFVTASQELDRAEHARERRQLEEEKRRTRELREVLGRERDQARRLHQASVRQRAQARRLKQLLGAVGAVLCLALVAAGVALQQRSHARANGEQAQNRQLQAAARAGIGADPRAALLLAVAAYRKDPSPQSRATLTDVLSGAQYAGSLDASGWVDNLSYSEDGRTLAVGRGDGAVGLWDASRSGEPRKLAEVVAKETSFFGKPAVWIGGDGTSLLLTGADTDRSVGRFSLADRGHPRPQGRMALPLQGFVEQAEFSPDGRMLLTTTSTVTRLWSVEPGRGAVRARGSLPQRKSNVQAAAFGPGGAVLVLGWQDGTVEVWDVEEPDRPRRLGTLNGTGGPPRSMAVSRDGATLAVASGDAQVRLWDVSRTAGCRPATAADCRPSAVISGHGGPVEAVALSKDGRRLALGSTDHSASVWDISGYRPVRSAVLTGHATTVSALAFSPDGRTLASGDHDGAVRFWSLTDRLAPTVAARPVRVPTPDFYRWFESVVPYVLAPDGRLLALATGERELSLIPLTGRSAGRPAGVARLDEDGYFSNQALWFSQEGTRLAVEGPRGTLTMWNVKDPAHPVRQFRLKAGGSDSTLGLEVAIRGDLMVTGSEGEARLWDLSRPTHPTRLSSIPYKRKTSRDVLFAPKSRLLAIGESLYDVSDPRTPDHLSDLPAPDKRPFYPRPRAFSPDGGKLVAAQSGDSGGLLYDVSDPGSPRFLSGLPQSSGTGPYSFGKDGTLLTGSGSGTRLHVWDVWDPTAPHSVASFTLDKEATALGMSPDGTVLTTYNYPGETIHWNIAQLAAALRDPVGRACRLAVTNPTLAEWNTMAPGIPFRRVCPTLAPAPSPPPADAFPIIPRIPQPLPAGK